MKLFFVTSNKSKYVWARERLKSIGIELEQRKIDLPESRDLEVRNVAIAKAKKAFNILKKPVMVEDRGFYIEALNGFPATFIEFMHKTIGVKGLMKLMKNNTNRKASFISVLIYIDEKGSVKTFKEKEEGFIVTKIAEGNCRGWGNLMNIYGHEIYPGRALSELNDEEWKKYQDVISENDYLSKFYNWFINERGADD
ncbi:MAG: non-canonical purine NTP pyrophosphatase [Nanoarchaeota archaeon]|nr:non-canonical purine NTP pyrophosphatase [Nanoarchaeota archaeon]MBU1031044.1 non-canonical purine NTP pyrophosphatase [Nanoarchaeota archaeon]MBU1850383.1 non-canonical purine NTP pyrophosphatase [Nanoarchaeota archaeon]